MRRNLLVRVAAIDLADARRYLKSVASMCAEGSCSDHRGVVILALRLLERQRTRDFKQKAVTALQKIQTVYPGLKLRDAPGGIVVLASSRPAVPSPVDTRSFPR